MQVFLRISFSVVALIFSLAIKAAEIADISFDNPGWSFTSGASYDPVSQELLINGNANTYEYARITVNLPGGTSDIYLSGDVFLENIVLGNVAWYAPKIKIVNLKTENLSSPAQGSWYNAFVSADATGESSVTLEFGFQNSTGVYKVKAPKFTDSQPVPTPYSFPYAIPGNTTTTLNLVSSDTMAFNNDLLSTNAHFSWASKKWGDQEVIDAINNNFPMSNFRFPGGTVGNFYNWTTDGYYNDASTFDSPSRQNLYNAGFTFDYPGYKNQVLASSGNATLMFNVIHDDATAASARLQSRIADGLNVKWIELGNENFYGTQSYGYISNNQWQVSDVAQYIAHTKNIVTALKAVDNTIALAVNVNHHDYSNGSWSQTLAGENYYDATTVHNYNNVGTESLDYSSGVVLLDSYKYTRKNIETYKSYFGNTPTIITEWGVLGSKSFLGVLSAADMFLALLEGNTADTVVQQAGIHMLYHSDDNIAQSLMYLDGSTVKYTPTGVMYAKLFDVFKNQKLYSNLSSSEEITTDLPGTISRAIDLGDSIKVYTVNKLPVASTIALKLDGQDVVGDYVLETYAMSPELWPDGVTNPNNAWAKTTEQGPLVVPAYSITVISIPKPNVTSLNDAENQQVIQAYPNPSTTRVYLKGVKIGERVSILDLSGRVLKVLRYDSNGIDVSFLSSGMYGLLVKGQFVPVAVK